MVSPVAGLILLAVLAVSAVIAFFFSSAIRAVHWTDVAVRALKARDYARAELYYTKLDRLCQRLKDKQQRNAVQFVAAHGLSVCHENRGDFESTERCLTQAVQLLDDGVEHDCGTRANLLANLAVAHHALGREQECTQTLQLLRQCCDEVQVDDIDHLVELVTGAAAGASVRNHKDLAIKIAEIAQAALEKSGSWHDGALAHLKITIAGFYLMRCEYEVGRDLILSAIETSEDHLDFNDLATAWSRLGWINLLTLDFEQSRSAFDRSYRVRSEEFGTEHWKAGLELQAMADSRRAYGDYSDAVGTSDRAWRILTNALKPGDSILAGTAMNRSLLLIDVGRFEEADKILSAAVETAAEASDIIQLCALRLAQGIAANTRGWYYEAEKLLSESQSLVDEAYGEGTRMTCDVMSIRASNMIRRRRTADALQLVERSIDIREASTDLSVMDLADSLVILADALVESNRLEDAETALARWSTLVGDGFAPTNLARAEVSATLGRIASQRQDYSTAMRHFTKALDIRQEVQSNDHPSLVELLEYSAACLRNIGQAAKADQQEKRAHGIREKYSPSPHGENPYLAPKST